MDGSARSSPPRAAGYPDVLANVFQRPGKLRYHAVFAPTPERSRFSAIYTRRDEVVQWQSCIDDTGTNFEVSGLHASLIVNPAVYRILGSILADAAADNVAA
jgi:hypothetical protein